MTTLETHIVLSTAHLSEEVNKMLEEMGEDREDRSRFGDWRDGIVRTGYAYGHWVKAPYCDPNDPDDTIEARMQHLPECLAACLRRAASFGARWVLFDRDESETDLPCYY